jgi:hypothetical protein
MPIDPRTGERLPGEAGMYAGEPGAPADAPPADGAGPTGQDLVDRAAEIDQILSPDEMASLGEAEAAMGGAMPAEGGMPPEGGMDMAPLAEALGVPPERAQEIYDAAQQMPQLAGVPVEELAQMLSADIELRMQVEALAAGASDAADAEAAEAEMAAGGEMPPVPM